jgi:hypothetical protein
MIFKGEHKNIALEWLWRCMLSEKMSVFAV